MTSGSEKRRRGDTITVRVTPDERAAIDELSALRGMSVGAFMRATALGDPGPRAQRRVPIDAKMLRRLVGEVGRVGNNLNQIAHRLNARNEYDEARLQAALAAHDDLRKAILAVLGVPTK